jgi:hypothetical protein
MDDYRALVLRRLAAAINAEVNDAFVARSVQTFRAQNSEHGSVRPPAFPHKEQTRKATGPQM